LRNCAVQIKRQRPLEFGRSRLVKINLSASYAIGGDTVQRTALGSGGWFQAGGVKNPRLTELMLLGGHTTPGGMPRAAPPGLLRRPLIAHEARRRRS
jgi:hypothetical protein